MNQFLPSLRDNRLVKGAESPGPPGLEASSHQTCQCEQYRPDRLLVTANMPTDKQSRTLQTRRINSRCLEPILVLHCNDAQGQYPTGSDHALRILVTRMLPVYQSELIAFPLSFTKLVHLRAVGVPRLSFFDVEPNHSVP